MPPGEGPAFAGAARAGRQRRVERAAIAAEFGGDAAEMGDARIVLTLRIEAAGQRDLCQCQRAGLVGAQYRHGAEVVDRGQPLDDDFARRHAHRAARQGDGGNHRQQFRRQPDRQGHREQQ